MTNPNFAMDDLHPNVPHEICAYIYMKCEAKGTVHKSTGQLMNCEGRKFTSAIAIRAALSKYYADVFNVPGVRWNVNDHGYCSGNPVLSLEVCTYLASLKKRKVSEVGKTSFSSPRF